MCPSMFARFDNSLEKKTGNQLQLGYELCVSYALTTGGANGRHA